MNGMTNVIFAKGDFMKKQLTVALGLAVLATPAFATKARLQSLGEDTYGSFYVNDNRNIWLNAAQINNHRDLVTFETGTSGVGTRDSAAAPRAEGGFYKQGGNLVYGVHFGGGSDTSNLLRSSALGSAAHEEDNLDIFVGGDTGLKWGANVGYSKHSEDETAAGTDLKESDSLRTRLGVIAGDTQAYANINLTNKAELANGTEFKGKLGYQLGAIQAWNGYSFNVDYRSFKGENDTTSDEIKHDRIQLSAGRVTRLNDRASLFTRATLDYFKTENEGATGQDVDDNANCNAGQFGAGCEELKVTRLPVVIGLESEATSWLTLRASVGQNLMGKQEGKNDKTGLYNTTLVNLGASLKFGELTVDGVVGNNDGTSATVGENTSAGAGTLRSDVLMTRVAATYRF